MHEEIQDLDRQIAELQSRRDALLFEHKQKAIHTVRQLVKQFGLTHAQVGLSSISRTKLRSKTMRPTTFYDSNRGLAWDGSLSGMGRKPDWIRQAIADKTVESFRVMVQSNTRANS
jgi:DNA-binding protein H-NS